MRIVRFCRVLVEGIITTQCPTGGSDSVMIRNVKSITHYGWGDGLNVFASNNVLMEGVFCRNSDDSTTAYGTRLGFYGPCRNITMRNVTLWADRTPSSSASTATRRTRGAGGLDLREH